MKTSCLTFHISALRSLGLANVAFMGRACAPLVGVGGHGSPVDGLIRSATLIRFSNRYRMLSIDSAREHKIDPFKVSLGDASATPTI